jgi:ribosome-associated protein
MKGKELVESLIEWSVEKKGDNIKFYDLQGKTSYTDFVLLVEGSSELHINAIAQNIVECSKQNKLQINGKEGFKSSSWILIDFVDVIVHVVTPSTREFYKLDNLFSSIQNEEAINQDFNEEDLND